MSRRSDKRVVREFKAIASDLELCQALRQLYHRLRDIEDPRSSVNREYELPDIFMLLILGLLIGKNDPTNIHNFLSKPGIKAQIDKILGYGGKIPSKQVFLNQLHITDPRAIMTVMDEWQRQYFSRDGRHIALDGKAVRAALKKVQDKHNPPYILNALEVGTGLFVMQEKVGEKTNEAGSLPGFASMLELNGADVTIDAAGTHANIASMILSSDGHFCLPVKDNQKHMRLAIERAFNAAEESTTIQPNYYEEMAEKLSHGRCEDKFCWVLSVVEGSELFDFLQHSDFKDMVHAVGKLIRAREIIKRKEDGTSVIEQSEQTIYYIMSRADITAQRLCKLAQAHWSVESAHYVLDTEFDEDRSTIRKGYGMENMSLLRKIAFNVLRILRRILGNRCTFESARDEFLTRLSILKNLFRPFSKREMKTVLIT